MAISSHSIRDSVISGRGGDGRGEEKGAHRACGAKQGEESGRTLPMLCKLAAALIQRGVIPSGRRTS